MRFVLAMAFTDPRQACALAAAAERAGWAAVAVSDHVVQPAVVRSPYPYTADGKPRFAPDTPWPDPWVLIGAMAGATSRIRFLTNVFVLPLRNPFVVAKAVSTAAVVSGDRVSLGIGMGWMEEEFELLGQPFRRRGRRADEMVEILRKLWSGELVTHRGEFYSFGEVRMLPAPNRPIPLYVGGTSERALGRAARLGDGWISDLHSADDLVRIAAHLRRLREEHGRADRPFEIIASVSERLDPAKVRRLEQAGVTHLMSLPWLRYRAPADSLAEKEEAIARFAAELIEDADPSGGDR